MGKSQKRVVKSIIRKFDNLGFLLIGFLAVVFSIIFFGMGKKASKNLVKQATDREVIVIKSGARAIESFLFMTANSMALLAENTHLQALDNETKEILNYYISNNLGKILAGVGIVNQKGYYQFAHGPDGEVVDRTASVADRDYVVWSKTAKKGDIFAGKPIIPRIGGEIVDYKYVIPLATPIYSSNGTYRGVLVTPIDLSLLAKYYLEPLRISDSTSIHLVDSDGIFLYSTSGDLFNVNMFEFIEGLKFPSSEYITDTIKKTMDKRESGASEFRMPNIQNPLSEPWERMLRVYHPIQYSSNYWYLNVIIPTKDLVSVVAPFYINQIGIIIASFIFLLMLTVIITKRRAYKKGFTIHGDIHKEDPDKIKAEIKKIETD